MNEEKIDINPNAVCTFSNSITVEAPPVKSSTPVVDVIAPSNPTEESNVGECSSCGGQCQACDDMGIPYERPKIVPRKTIRRLGVTEPEVDANGEPQPVGPYSVVYDKASRKEYKQYLTGAKVEISKGAVDSVGNPVFDRDDFANRMIDHYNAVGFKIIDLHYTDWDSTPNIHKASLFKWWQFWKYPALFAAKKAKEAEVEKIKDGIDKNVYRFAELDNLLALAYGKNLDKVKTEIGPI